MVHADKEHDIDTDHSGLNKCAGREDGLYTKLKEAIDSLKAPSLLEQADIWIREKHYKDRLKIERLSGQQLPTEQCYINLVIVEQFAEDANRPKEGDAGPSPFSILARQKVETPDKAIQVELATIFSQRKGRDGRMIEPRRILIRGRAGVGKTTLCKKIVHDFAHGKQTELHRSWTKLFDRLLWIPLRHLKGRSTYGYNHEDLFYHEYFSSQGHDDGKCLAKELWRELNDTRSSRTLFLLDGLDEVSGLCETFLFLKTLLNQTNVIVTSRPNANLPDGVEDLDLQLETIGFYPEQVERYIEKSFTDQKTARTNQNKVDKVQSFLRKHWLIRGLVRIPIQLDALCYTWDDHKSKAVPDTMTGLYKEIELKLWQKDICRLKQTPLEECRSMNYKRATEEMGDELRLLEVLAFTGLHNDILDFDGEHRNDIYNHFELSVTGSLIESLSFLRTSDPSSEDHDRNYHFIHLTFQEYFAARYFAQQWSNGRKLKYLEFDSRKPNMAESDPIGFLQKHKYNARYDVFWRFVAGLLNDNNGEQLNYFFKTIEEEPIDLLGPAHQRLVMHCLSEVDASTDLPNRSKMEGTLSQWLLFECDLTGTSLLAREPECPDKALHAALRLNSGRGRERILEALARSSRQLSEATVAAVAALLKDKDTSVQSRAAYALGGQANLPEAIAAALLKDKYTFVQSRAIKALEDQSNMSKATAAALLKDKDASIRSRAATALQGQENLPKAIIVALIALLKDKDRSVQSSAAKALGHQANLPEEIVAEVVALLKDKDWSVRSSAAKALGYQANLPKEIVAAVAALLKDNNTSVRFCAAEALGGQANLPEEIVAAVAALLKDENGFVRFFAAKALGYQVNLPEEIVAAVAALLKDKDWSVRFSAAKALGHQVNLPEAIVAAVAALFKDEDASVRPRAAEALGRRSNLLDKILGSIGLLLESEKQPRTTTSTFDPQFVESFYGSLLWRSFRDQSILYIDGRSCIINQANGVRKACLEKSSLHSQFLTALSKGRQLWNPHGYKLWGNFERDDTPQGLR